MLLKMFHDEMFSQMKRSGFKAGISKNKLTKIMVEILLQLPKGSTKLKDRVIANMGLTGQMSTTRDINDAWNRAKKIVTKEHPTRFISDGRNIIHWNDSSVKVLDKNISALNFKKLNELAQSEICNVNELISILIREHKKAK